MKWSSILGILILAVRGCDIYVYKSKCCNYEKIFLENHQMWYSIWLLNFTLKGVSKNENYKFCWMENRQQLGGCIELAKAGRMQT